MIDTDSVFNDFKRRFEAMTPKEQREYLKKMGFQIDVPKFDNEAFVSVGKVKRCMGTTVRYRKTAGTFSRTKRRTRAQVWDCKKPTQKGNS